MPGIPTSTMADAGPPEDDKSSAQAFSLKNTSSSFAGKSSDIFGSLAALEQKHEAHVKQRTDSGEAAEDKSLWKADPDEETKGLKTDDRGRRSEREREAGREGTSYRDRSYRHGRERESDDRRRLSDSQDYESRPRSPPSQFRRPRGGAPGRGRNRIPDFRQHPERWTHYSLEDVDRDDMSESSNKRAALAFLEERRKLREAEEGESTETPFDTSSAACSKGLITFSRRTKSGTSDSSKAASSSSTSVSASVDLPLPDSSSVENETVAVSDDSVTDTDKAMVTEKGLEQASSESTFKKSRKGIRRNIRSRDDDD